MIGFVNVQISNIKKAYEYLNDDDKFTNEQIASNKKLSERIGNMSNIINTSAGHSNIFLRKKEKIKLKSMLQEVAYASYLSETDSMMIRIEMASIILDIIKICEDNQNEKLERIG